MKKITTILDKTAIISLLFAGIIWVIQSIVYGDWHPTNAAEFFYNAALFLSVVSNLIRYSSK